MAGLIDIHSHVLPGVDDGPADVDQAAQLALDLAQLGFTDLHPTPHQRAGFWAPTMEQRNTARDALRAELAERGAAIRIHPPGGENMWDELLLARQSDASFPRYSGDKSFLLELSPVAPPPNLETRLFEFRMKGCLPVIAHIERYMKLTDDLERVEQLGERAALLVNLGALGGMGGWRIRSKARKLVQQGLIHAVTTDAHAPRDAEYCASGLEWLRQRLGDQSIEQLLVDGPRRILAGEIP